MDRTKTKIFLYVIDSGSFTKAAAAYGYTTSGISHMMSSMEEEFGFPLLIRSRSGVKPTANAEKLIPILRSQLSWDEQLQQTISEISGMNSGAITIAAYSSIASQWLPTVISRFHRDYPAIRINLLEGVWQEVANYLANRQADIGFYSYFPTIPYRWVFLRKDPMMVAIPPDHPLAAQSSVRLDQLVGETLIFPAYGADVDVLRLIEGSGVKVEYSISTLYNYPAFRMVEQGLGLVITNRLITQGLSTRMALLPVEPASSIDLGIAIPDESENTPAVERFVTYAQRIIPQLP